MLELRRPLRQEGVHPFLLVGGAEQGGASLTDDGAFVLERYRAMQAATRAAIAPAVSAVAKRRDISGRK